MNYDFTAQSANPMQGINNALQTYGSMRNIQLQEEQAGLQRQEYAQKQEAAAEKRAAALKYQAELEDVAEKPTPANIRRLYLSNPKAHEAWSSLMDREDAERKSIMTQNASDIYMMLNSGNIEGAKNKIDGVIKAAENSGNQEQVQSWTMYGEMLDRDPNSLALASGQILSATKEGREILESMDKSANKRAGTRKLGAETREINQKMVKALETSQLDQLNAVVESINNGVDHNTIAEILGKDNLSVKASKQRADVMRAEAAGNEVKAEEARMKLEETKELAEQKVRDVTFKVAQAQMSLDSDTDLLLRIKNNPELAHVLGASEGNLTVEQANRQGNIRTALFGSSTLDTIRSADGRGGGRGELRAQAIIDLEQLNASKTIATLTEAKQAGATFGATNETEIGLLMKAGTNVDRRKGEKAFISMIDARIARNLVLKKGLADKYGVPVPPVESDEFLNQPDLRDQVNDALIKYPPGV